MTGDNSIPSPEPIEAFSTFQPPLTSNSASILPSPSRHIPLLHLALVHFAASILSPNSQQGRQSRTKSFKPSPFVRLQNPFIPFSERNRNWQCNVSSFRQSTLVLIILTRNNYLASLKWVGNPSLLPSTYDLSPLSLLLEPSSSPRMTQQSWRGFSLSSWSRFITQPPQQTISSQHGDSRLASPANINHKLRNYAKYHSWPVWFSF